MSLQLATERLIVRPLREEDVVPLASIWSDPRVTEFMGGPRDFEQMSASFRERVTQGIESDFLLQPVIEKASGTLVGHCGLLQKEIEGVDEIELVYVIASHAWNHGYATEVASAIRDYAFQTLGLTRLVALIDPHNVASERVAIKVGMTFERETIRPNGKRMQTYVKTKG